MHANSILLKNELVACAFGAKEKMWTLSITRACDSPWLFCLCSRVLNAVQISSSQGNLSSKDIGYQLSGDLLEYYRHIAQPKLESLSSLASQSALTSARSNYWMLWVPEAYSVLARLQSITYWWNVLRHTCALLSWELLLCDNKNYHRLRSMCAI